MPNILLVEDSPENRQLVTWMLEDAEGCDYSIAEAESAEVGLSLLQQQDVDLVLMDITLPGMDGKEVIRQIRANEKFVSLPIIALTGHTMEDEVAAILDSGANLVSPKPVDEDALLADITELIAAAS